MDLTNYLKAGYPTLYITTQEPERATRSISANGWKTFSWDCIRGVTIPDQFPKVRRHGFQPVADQPSQPSSGGRTAGLKQIVLAQRSLPRIVVGLLQQQVGDHSTLSNFERASRDVCSVTQWGLANHFLP